MLVVTYTVPGPKSPASVRAWQKVDDFLLRACLLGLAKRPPSFLTSSKAEDLDPATATVLHHLDEHSRVRLRDMLFQTDQSMDNDEGKAGTHLLRTLRRITKKDELLVWLTSAQFNTDCTTTFLQGFMPRWSSRDDCDTNSSHSYRRSRNCKRDPTQGDHSNRLADASSSQEKSPNGASQDDPEAVSTSQYKDSCAKWCLISIACVQR